MLHPWRHSFVRDSHALDEALLNAKLAPCPRCRRAGMLIFHGMLWGYAERAGDCRGRLGAARVLAYLRVAHAVAVVVARRAIDAGGLALRRAGIAPAGQCTNFHEAIAASMPLRPAGPGRTVPLTLSVLDRGRFLRWVGQLPAGQLDH